MAHRLRTIYDSDQILVLKDGRVAERGSHRELLDLDGIYAELWNGETFFISSDLHSILVLTLVLAQELSLAQDMELERSQEKEDQKETK